MRLVFAILICKLTRLALRLAGRGGTALPGKLALRVCPDMLSKLSHGVTTVMVTGTNGKTTTCRMLEQMLRDAEKLLNDEFALVLNIKPREVPEYIRSRLEEAS